MNAFIAARAPGNRPRLEDSAGVAQLKEQMVLHQPPVDDLVIATSGRFTADVVAGIETQNVTRTPMRISLWPNSHLELLLAQRPEIVAEFRLR